MKVRFCASEVPPQVRRHFKPEAEDPDAPHRFIICRDHHDTSYFHARTLREAAIAALAVLKYRWEDGACGDARGFLREQETSPTKPPDVPREKVAKLPSPRLRAQLNAEWAAYDDECTNSSWEGLSLSLVVEALDEHDAAKALVCCWARREAEDEGFDIEVMSDPLDILKVVAEDIEEVVEPGV